MGIRNEDVSSIESGAGFADSRFEGAVLTVTGNQRDLTTNAWNGRISR